MTSIRAKILLVEGKRGDAPVFLGGLSRKGFDVAPFQNGKAALDYLKKNTPHVVLINAASMQTSGRRICQSVHQLAPNIPILLIVEEGYKNQGKLDAEVLLTLPFTLQKLLNRLRPLLPAEEKNLIKAGPLYLDTDQRWVRYNNRQISLTPRLIMLLRVLMDHPGEVIERETLFKQVWETDYTGDTRTLDVHVSWLRQAIEEDPRHPRFVKTVRGVGYRLDVEPDTRPARARKP
ncbi:MAG: response regulator transcription factor [Anaerolineae bacterium]|nr:response regulator transcription factor [Anaerolineae bacterium]